MTDRLFRYIPIGLMPAALAAGWHPTSALAGTSHGAYSVLCEWLCACPEAWPLDPTRLGWLRKGAA